MNSIWNNLYDRVKDRRYGTFFFISLAVFLGTFIFGSMIYTDTGAKNLLEFFMPALPGIGILLVALSWRIIRRARTRWRERLKYPPLSRDEIRKARSKLRNEKRPMRQAAPRAPDIDLKY
jgi:hypothetical protein